MSNERARSRYALQACAEWLAFCLSIGWKKSSLDRLEATWWEHHDDNGAQAMTPPPSAHQELLSRIEGATILNPLIEIRRALAAGQSAIKSRERWSEGLANCFDGAFKALDELDAELSAALRARFAHE